VLVVGAESTATRLINSILLKNPSIKGTPNARNHTDRFDEVWRNLSANDPSAAKSSMPSVAPGDIYVTRRSVPHSQYVGEPAQFKEWPKLHRFADTFKSLGFQLLVLITVRSPWPSLVSWAAKRASTQGDVLKAWVQYQEFYRLILSFIEKYNLSYYFIPQEGIMLDQGKAVNSLFKVIGIESLKKV